MKDNNLGGVSVWAADFDDFKGLCGVKWPLLTAINKDLRGFEPPTLHADINPPTQPYGSCSADGFYTDAKNCAAYYICKNGLSYHLSCGKGLMFDPATGKCDRISANYCKPGQTIYIPTSLKSFENNLLKLEKLNDDSNELKVICYITNWAFYRKADGKFVPEHIDQRLCTHVVYAFASLDPEKLLMKEFDPWADIDNS